MQWLRQQARVEALSFELQQNAGQMSRLAQRLKQRVYARLRQPGTLAWAFAAGTLFGASREREHGHGASAVIHYFNSVIALWSLLTKYQTRQL